MSFFSAVPEMKIPAIYLNLGKHRLLNLVRIERACFYSVFFMLLIPLVFRSTLYIYTFDPFFAMLCLLWFIRTSASGNYKISAANICIVDFLIYLLLFWTLISVVFAININVSFIKWLLFLRGIIFYTYLRANWNVTIHLKDIINIALITLSLESILALIQFGTSSSFGSINAYFGETESYYNAYFYTSLGRITRAVGTFDNPNLLADWVLLFSPIIYSCFYYNFTSHRLLFIVLMLLCVCAIAFTFSRSGWLSFGVGIAALWTRLFLTDKRSVQRLLKHFLVYLFLLPIFAIVILIVGRSVCSYYRARNYLGAVFHRFY